MGVFLEILALVGGLAVLIVSADLLVRGAAQLARLLGLSPFAIGVTVVAFGTSAPELFASIGAAFQGEDELAISNVMGSNVANILLILGAGGMIAPIVISRRVRFVELPIMLAISIGTAALLSGGALSRTEGVGLCLGLLAYVVFIVRTHREDIEEQGAEGGAPKPTLFKDLAMIIAGSAGLALGAWALVYGATGVATQLGVSSAVIGMTVVALGTSLPELAATVRAAMVKSSDIAVGNVVGSNIFNLLSVLGITSLVHPLVMPDSQMKGVWLMLGVSLGMVLFGLARSSIGRWVGAVFLLLYAGYTAYAFVG